MTVMAHLFDYTLNVLCGGNKSECARKLDMRRPDLNRMEQRLKEGASSTRTLESILELFWKEKHSIDEAMKGYQTEASERNDSQANSICDDVLCAFREKLANERQITDKTNRLLRGAEAFLAVLTYVYCSDACRNHCGTDCPCSKFIDLVNWLRGEVK